MAKRFTQEELQKIIIDYNDGLRPFELAQKYNRNISSIINKLKSLGLYKNTRYRFTEEDLSFLREYYPKGNWEIIKERFPNLPKTSILNKMSQQGIKMINPSKWTLKEINILKEYYSKGEIEKIKKEIPYRSYEAITTKAQRLGLKTRNYWTIEEDNKLIEIYPIMSLNNVMEYFPNRTRNAIIKHAIKLGVQSFDYRPWTEEENFYLKDNWKKESDDIISCKLNRTPKAVQARRLNLGLCYFNKDWSGYHELSKFLRAHIQTWKIESMKKCNYQCVLTGSKDFEIHHLYSFSEIVHTVIKENNFPLKQFNEYTHEELKNILKKFQEEHNKTPLGVCIRKDLHKLYHSIYKKGINTEQQWQKFIQEYNSGIYNNIEIKFTNV